MTTKDVLMRTDKCLTLEELAAYLKLSQTKLYRMAQKGEIPASKIGTQWRFDRDEIDEWMKRKKGGNSENQSTEKSDD